MFKITKDKNMSYTTINVKVKTGINDGYAYIHRIYLESYIRTW